VAEAPLTSVGHIVRRFWPHARDYRPWLAVMLALVVVTPLADAASIWLFKLLVDEVLVPRDLSRLPMIAAAYLGITLASGALSFGDDYLSTWLGEHFLLRMRAALFRHLQGLSLEFFDRRPLGDLVSRLTDDVNAIETFVLSGVADLLSYSLRIVFFTAALVYLQWQLAIVALVVSPVFWLVARWFARALKRAARERRRRAGSISAVAQESLGHVALVQAYNRQADESKRFEEQAAAGMAAQLASARLKAIFSPMVDLVQMAATLVVIGAGAWFLVRSELSLGGLLVFVAYLSRLYSPIRGLGRLGTTVFAATASAERVIEVLDERPLVSERADAVRLSRVAGQIDFDNVSFVYPGAQRPAIEDISFHVEPGQMLAVVGPSGAGKSTIARLLLRFHDPTQGSIRLDGADLRSLTLESLRDQITLLLQETPIFDGTVRENIAFGRAGAIDADIEAAARAADAHEFIRRLPSGYDTRLGQQGRRLSGGQRQRIAIARALVRNTPVLILDEPTTGLDRNSTERILLPLKRLMQGRTTILISHSATVLGAATHILELESGRSAERRMYVGLA
jgi:ATP-binding cassette, subfamily B, bacterial